MPSSVLTSRQLLDKGNDGRIPPVLNVIWPQLLGVVFGISSGVAINFGTRRPLFSGLQKHIIGIIGWTALLTYAQDKRNRYYAEKDAVMRHYMELHEDEFVELERTKIADVFEPWAPIR